MIAISWLQPDRKVPGAHRRPAVKQRPAVKERPSLRQRLKDRLMAWNATSPEPQPLNLREAAGRSARQTAVPTTALFTGLGSIALHSTAMTCMGAAMYALSMAAGWLL